MKLRQENGMYEPGAIVSMVVLGLVGVVLFFALLFAWPFKKVDRGEIGLSYGGGIVEGRHYQGLKEPGSLFFNGFGDKLYRYPTTQRNYIISSRKGEGDVGQPDSVTAVSRDNVAVSFEVATYFKLNIDKVRQFHEQIGLKYSAWDHDGWDKMLNDSFRQQIENTLQDLTRTFTVADIYSNADVLHKIQTEIGSSLRDRVAESLGGDYFCGPTYHQGGDCTDFSFIVKKIGVPTKVAAAFESNRTSAIEVQTKQNEIAQAQAQASAAAALATAIANNPNYIELKRIEALQAAINQGGVKFWVLPSGTGVNIGTPAP